MLGWKNQKSSPGWIISFSFSTFLHCLCDAVWQQRCASVLNQCSWLQWWLHSLAFPHISQNILLFIYIYSFFPFFFYVITVFLLISSHEYMIVYWDVCVRSVSLHALLTVCVCVSVCPYSLLGVSVYLHFTLSMYACVSIGSGWVWGGQTQNGQMIQVLHSSSINYQLITVMQPI